MSILANPIKDLIIIRVAEPSLIKTEGRIINTQGMIVKRFTLQQGITTVDISTLPSGNYYLQTKAGSSKIILNK